MLSDKMRVGRRVIRIEDGNNGVKIGVELGLKVLKYLGWNAKNFLYARLTLDLIRVELDLTGR